MRSTVILLFYDKTSLFPFNDFKQIYLLLPFFHIQWLASLVKAKNAAKKCTLKSSLCLQQGQQHSTLPSVTTKSQKPGYPVGICYCSFGIEMKPEGK